MLPVLAWLLAVFPAAAAGQSTVLASEGDAYVTEDSRGRGWTIGNGAVRYRLEAGAGGVGFRAMSLERPAAGERWPLQAGADMTFSLAGKALTPGAAGFALHGSRADVVDGAVRLTLTFEAGASRLRLTRVYACYPEVPFIETWSVFEATAVGAALALSDVDVWRLTLPATTLNWVTGLTPRGGDAAFTRRSRAVSAGRIDLGATGRSSEQEVPAFWLDGEAGQVIGGLAWSGQWALAATPAGGGRVGLRLSLGEMEKTVSWGQTLEAPHGFIGVAGGGPPAVTASLRSLILRAIRRDRPFEPSVTYNTWFAYGTRIDEEAMRSEMERASSLGVELFVLDAGWYPTRGGIWEFGHGLGEWYADTERFPSGLASLADHARSLGLKFGLWVEPERVDLENVGRPGLPRERLLATADGRYHPGAESASSAQLCLGDEETRQWVFAQLVRLIDEVRPDYLKWDNNYWINCDREDHGHGPRDGNFSHVEGLYAILAALRSRYPSLVIENCSGGGNRLDLGLLRYTDVGWMDDVSAPSSHVRHNLHGLSAIFPPAYVLSFVIDDRDEPLHGAADMTLYMRSRMAGVLGLTWKTAEFGDEDAEQIKEGIAEYKVLRPLLSESIAVLLTDQVNKDHAGAWDATQLLAPNDSAILVFAGADAPSGFLVRPVALADDASYRVHGDPGEPSGDARGTDWMANGLEVYDSGRSRSHLIWFTKAIEVAEPAVRRAASSPATIR